MAYGYEIPITLAGGRRVDAYIHGHLIRTDQPRWKGGKDKDPAPFDLFLASIGTCAGLAIQSFCAARGFNSDDIKLAEHVTFDDDGDLSEVSIEIVVPTEFPSEHMDTLQKVVEQCQVERVIRTQPLFVVTKVREADVP